MVNTQRAVVALIACALFSGAAVAHDFDWTGGMKLGDPPVTVEHPDADPWAGWVNVSVTNTGAEPWGDFHFEIFQVGDEDPSNVDWMEDPTPTSSQSPLTWVIDNTDPHATIDVYFYADPVYPGETATFSVYNVNPDQVSFFGVSFYPTPVPEPAGLLLLGLGATVLRRR